MPNLQSTSRGRRFATGLVSRKPAERRREVPRATPRRSGTVVLRQRFDPWQGFRSSGVGRDRPRSDEGSSGPIHLRRSGVRSPQLHQTCRSGSVPAVLTQEDGVATLHLFDTYALGTACASGVLGAPRALTV